MKRETSEVINEAAAEWVARIDRGPLSPLEQREFEGWLASDDRHFGGYVRALAVFTHTKRAGALGPTFEPDRFLAASQPSEAAVYADRSPSRLTRRAALKVAGFTAAGVGATLIFGLRQPAVAESYQTGRGEVRVVPLSDGSSLTLNTASKVDVLYTKNRRAVSLVNGEVLFDVALDPDRPFQVEAGYARARAVGTSFVVTHLRGAPVQMVVQEGSVDIGVPAAQGTGMTRAHAFNRVTVLESGERRVETLTLAEVSRELLWRNGLISFEDTSLAEAVRMFARYSDVRIHADEPEVASATVTGVFAADNPLSFARAAAESLGFDVETVSDGIRIFRKS